MDLLKTFFAIFKPAEHVERLPAEKIDPTYKRLRFQVFLGIFIGYAGYYLVRKNFALAMPYLLKEGFTTGDLGLIFSASSIAYGFSKFLMGNVSDRCNPRYFLSAGLILSGIINIVFGMTSYVLTSVIFMFVLMFLNGWVQGMGWPPCGRTMVHWYSVRERGRWVSVWNVAHNVGGGLIGPLAILGIALFGTWHSTFYFPGFIAIVVGLFILVTLRGTPQSEGLPPIEEYRNDYPAKQVANPEKELTGREIFFKYVFRNKYLWYIACANIFIYFIRYGVIDWVPTYLHTVKGFDHDQTSWAYFFYEYAGIPGTIVCGYLSDKIFKGRRSPIGIIYMVGVTIAVLVYWLNPSNSIAVYNYALIAIGFLIYGPVMLIGLHALDLVPKKAAGTAAGLTGLFGYLGGAMLADVGMGYIVQFVGWNGGFWALLVSCVMAIFFISLAWNSGASHQKASV